MRSAMIFYLATCLALICTVDGLAGRLVKIRVRENITQECPNDTPVNMFVVANDRNLVARDSIKFDMVEVYSGGDADGLDITTQTGENKKISFPGCYDARLTMRVNRPLVNPYGEIYIQMGTDIPCKKQEGPATFVGNVCTNITQNNWCPKSENGQLRGMLTTKQTCHYCNLCENAKMEAQRNSDKTRKFLQVGSGDVSNQCTLDSPGQPYTVTFRVCTPDRNEMNKANQENGRKAEEYWEYLKQGVMTVVIHLMERTVLSPIEKQNCNRLCGQYDLQARSGSSSQGYLNTLLNSIGKMCAPADKYVACIYHTMKFDVEGQPNVGK